MNLFALFPGLTWHIHLDIYFIFSAEAELIQIIRRIQQQLLNIVVFWNMVKENNKKSVCTFKDPYDKE